MPARPFAFNERKLHGGPAGKHELLVCFMKRILIPIVLLAGLFMAKGEVKMERFEYQDGDTVLEGSLEGRP